MQLTGVQRANSKTIERWGRHISKSCMRVSRSASKGLGSEHERIVTSPGCSVRRKRTFGRWPEPSARRGCKGSNTSLRQWPLGGGSRARRPARGVYVVEHLGDEASGALIRGRYRFVEEGREEVDGSSTPVHRDGRQEGELPRVGGFLCSMPQKRAARRS